ncbi:MAG: hypothetical protein AAF732_06925 [Pseudomonadota bacterium]
MSIGEALVLIAQLWLYAGATVAAAFLLIGIDRVDESARGAYTFRPLLVPGILLLWPLVLVRWFVLEASGHEAARRDRPLRDAHAWVWLVLAILIPAILIGSLTLRQSRSVDDATVRIQAPAQ